MQMKIRRLLITKLSATVSILLFSVFLTGCSKSGSNPVSSQQVSTVQGQVSGQPGVMRAGNAPKFATTSSTDRADSPNGGIQGATVTLAEIQVDGSLKTVSMASVKTDATGHFSVGTNLNGVSDLVAVATDGSNQWEAIVSGEVANGNTVDCQPLTSQTTVQAQAYSRIVADGKSSGFTTADLQLFINSSVAASVAGNSGAIAQLAAAMEEESAAQTTAFAQFSVSQTQLATAATAREQVQVELESALYSAGGDSSKDDAALEAYSASTVGAFVASAGIPVEVLAKTEEISCSALTNASSSMSAGAQFTVQQSASLIRAGLMGEVVVSEMQSGGASQSEIASADSANSALLAAIDAGTSGRDITMAFANYHLAILAQLGAMAGANANAITRVDDDINVAGGVHSTLQTTLSAAGTPGAVVQAYMTYYSSVSTMMQGMGGMSSAQLDAATQILMLIDSN